jgi:hypothetical protein
MSEQQTRIEYCGNLQVHHPIQTAADTRSPDMIAFDAEVARKIQYHNEHVAPALEFWAHMEQFKKRAA